MKQNYGIAIHGGAGTILRNQMSAEMESEYRQALHEAMCQGYEVLQNGGSSLDAVESAVRSLEDCPLFNAGCGSVYNSHGSHEMDAAVMYGADKSAGAVSLVRNVKNPVSLARAVMEQSDHVYLCGDGAEKFAWSLGLEFMPDAYFHTEMRYEQWQVAKSNDRVELDHAVAAKKFGTVGAVALDKSGNLAAATSTGGMTNKQFGRVGDSPIIGAGTFAENESCAVSCTGHGELFIRAVAAYDIAALMKYKGLSLADACREVVMKKLVTIRGEGGLVAIDRAGNIEMPFNSSGMYRACKSSNGREVVAIYQNE